MASYGVDRYGRPMGYDQDANPNKQQAENNPAQNNASDNPQAQGQGGSNDQLQGSFGPPAGAGGANGPSNGGSQDKATAGGYFGGSMPSGANALATNVAQQVSGPPPGQMSQYASQDPQKGQMSTYAQAPQPQYNGTGGMQPYGGPGPGGQQPTWNEQYPNQQAPDFKLPSNNSGFPGPQQNAPADGQQPPQAGANPPQQPYSGSYGVIPGFDTAKLQDPNSGQNAGSKYTQAARTFSQAIGSGVQIGRNNLQGAIDFAKQNGFANATAVGDDKIDFGDGNGPVDVVRSDGQVVFQNTTGNPVWEQQYMPGGSQPQGGGPGSPAASILSQALASGPPQAPGANGAPPVPPPLGAGAGGMQSNFPQAGSSPQGTSQPPSGPGQDINSLPNVRPSQMGVDEAKLNPGDPVPNQPGKVFMHNGGGWVIADAGSAPSAPPQPGSGSYQGDWAAGFRPPDAASYKPGQLPQDQLATYNPYQYGTNAPDSYQGNTISQFQAPDGSNIDTPLQGLVQQLMGSTSMSDQNVAQLKESQKEQALSMQKQLQDQLGNANAARGFAGGGNLQANNRRIGEDTMSQVLSGNRSVDIAKMQQDRADQMGAAGLGNDYLNSQANRASQMFASQLAGQTAQSGIDQAKAASGQNAFQLDLQRQQAQADQNYKGYGSQTDATKFNLDRAISQEGLNKQGSDSLYNNWLSSNQLGLQNRGLNIDQTKTDNQNNQFNLSNDLANKQFEDDMKKWRAALNFQYQNGANQSNQSYWS